MRKKWNIFTNVEMYSYYKSCNKVKKSFLMQPIVDFKSSWKHDLAQILALRSLLHSLF
jgi:hypothetical protein